jgi:transposase
MQESIKLIAIDLAKDVFQIEGVNDQGRVIFKKRLKRSELLTFTAQLPACRIAMEACGGSHFWSRKFLEQGHAPCLIAAKLVKPFKKTSQKNDEHDAHAIGEAAQRPSMRYVGMKSLSQQDLQSLHRVRAQFVRHRTASVNQCRGISMEYGLVMPEGINKFREHFPSILEEDNGLTPIVRELLRSVKSMIDQLDIEIANIEKKIKAVGGENRDYQRLMGVPGVGPMTASLFLASVGDVSAFKNGRHLAAWAGLVPRQHSSGGHTKLMGITKAGDQDLRVMLVHGARALIQATRKKDGKDPQSQWILRLLEKKGWNVTAIAVANKNCRVMWHLVKHQEEFKKEPA